jgi:hypothetical protein
MLLERKLLRQRMRGEIAEAFVARQDGASRRLASHRRDVLRLGMKKDFERWLTITPTPMPKRSTGRPMA